MIYMYRCISWRDGVKVSDRIGQMESTEFYRKFGVVGEMQFMLTLNSWNAYPASNGDNATKLVHKYIYLGCE